MCKRRTCELLYSPDALPLFYWRCRSIRTPACSRSSGWNGNCTEAEPLE
ncbi:hypothetical protein N7532_002015 [Penicillium argentinense]|uniref:Uncharacterized protein n=1 Tax=Penicillium argentinense TaxID=1131581 RepID=A0A9W9KMB7_9EURO|nr:uncharacterized protein N7532_002015 [Penicillium argentinense]KAJ5111480.1 hypothetical protein N7532_002015 [Penicillium argentinense]